MSTPIYNSLSEATVLEPLDWTPRCEATTSDHSDRKAVCITLWDCECGQHFYCEECREYVLTFNSPRGWQCSKCHACPAFLTRILPT